MLLEIGQYVSLYICPSQIVWGYNHTHSYFFIDLKYSLNFKVNFIKKELDLTNIANIIITGYYSNLSKRLMRLELKHIDAQSNYFCIQNGPNILNAIYLYLQMIYKLELDKDIITDQVDALMEAIISAGILMKD